MHAMNRRRFLLGSAGVAGAVWMATGCRGGGGEDDPTPRREPAWTFEALDGESGWRDPLVWQDVVVDVCDSGPADTASLYGLDRRTGALRWRFRCPEGASQPVVSDGIVLLGTGNDGEPGTWFGVDASDGTERWRLPGVAKRYDAPVVVDGVAYISSTVTDDTSALRAVGVVDGKLRWSIPMAHRSRTVVATPHVLCVVTGRDPGRLTGLDSATGRQLWTSDTPVAIAETALSADGAKVFARGPKGTVAAHSTTDGRRLWEAPCDSYDSTIFTVTPESLFSAIRTGVAAFDTETGAVRWTAATRYSAGTPAPAVAHGIVAVATGDLGEVDDDGDVTKPYGDIHAFDAATGTQRWAYDARTKPYVLAAGPTAVYAQHGQARFSAFDPATGIPRWHLKLPAKGFVGDRPAFADNMVYASGDNIYAVPA